MTDPHHDLALVRVSALQLVHDVRLLDPAALAAPSMLPGWTRAHVVAHLVGNADGLTRLLHWADTGEVTPMYADAADREAAIEAVVADPAADLPGLLEASVARLLAAAEQLDDEQWQTVVRLGPGAQGRSVAAAEIPWRRLVEQEMHNVDLAGAYTPAHWADEFVHRLLAEVAERYLTRDDVPRLDLRTVDGEWASTHEGTETTSVEGPAPALLAWLTGRSSGEGLRVQPGPLPSLPAWA